MSFAFKDRLKAAVIHAGISLLVAAVSLWFVFKIWYPDPLHIAAGVTAVFFLVLCVDVVLGPVLTFFVYQKNKRTLKFDLAVIVLIQIAAFVYGIHAVAMGRPVWLVFAGDRFDYVASVDVDDSSEKKAKDEYRRQSWFGPKWVASRNPVDVEARNSIVFEAIYGGADLAQRPNLYVPLQGVHLDLMLQSQDLSVLANFNSLEEVERVLAENPKAVAWLPLMARGKAMVVLLNESTVDGLKVVDLNPWK